jgi:hypothetical protein
MNTILNAEENNQPSPFIEHDLESPNRRAKITGLICIGCAATAISLGIFSSHLYFLFLFLAATFGLLGYSEIEAVKKGLMSSVILLISGVLLILLFLLLFSTTSGQFLIFYALLSILIPLMLTVFTLVTNKVEIWKALIPLSIPAFHVITSMTANSETFWLGLLIVPLSWGLLGLVAYLGRK